MNASIDASAFGRHMEPVDYLMFRGEQDPRTRSAMISVSLLDKVPDFERVRAAFERASRVVLRLRQHVVVPALPVADPQWIVDPDFDLDFHLRRVDLPSPGTWRHLLDFTQPILAAPFDTARPLWEAYIVEGITEGEAPAALLLKLNHAVTDGMGALELFRQLYDFEPDADRGPMPPLPAPEDVSSGDLVRKATRRAPITVIGALGRNAGRLVRTTNTLVRDPQRSVRSVSRMVSSAQRVLGGPPAPPSPLLRRRGLGRRLEALEFPLADFRRAAKAGGGSVNDAYISALCGAMRRYHEALGVTIESLPLALPVSLRTDDDPVGGNRFAGARIAAPVAEPDPVKRMAVIRGMVTTAASEPAIDALSLVAPALARLPAPLLGVISNTVSGTDIQASNVPGYAEEPYIAGARIVKSWPFGPLPGVPMMIVLVTQGGVCYVGAHYDTASITDSDLFLSCLHDGFDEILALDPERRAPTRRRAARPATKVTKTTKTARATRATPIRKAPSRKATPR